MQMELRDRGSSVKDLSDDFNDKTVKYDAKQKHPQMIGQKTAKLSKCTNNNTNDMIKKMYSARMYSKTHLLRNSLYSSLSASFLSVIDDEICNDGVINL
jgi:hypothetical protein